MNNTNDISLKNMEQDEQVNQSDSSDASSCSSDENESIVSDAVEDSANVEDNSATKIENQLDTVETNESVNDQNSQDAVSLDGKSKHVSKTVYEEQSESESESETEKIRRHQQREMEKKRLERAKKQVKEKSNESDAKRRKYNTNEKSSSSSSDRKSRKSEHGKDKYTSKRERNERNENRSEESNNRSHKSRKRSHSRDDRKDKRSKRAESSTDIVVNRKIIEEAHKFSENLVWPENVATLDNVISYEYNFEIMCKNMLEQFESLIKKKEQFICNGKVINYNDIIYFVFNVFFFESKGFYTFEEDSIHESFDEIISKVNECEASKKLLFLDPKELSNQSKNVVKIEYKYFLLLLGLLSDVQYNKICSKIKLDGSTPICEFITKYSKNLQIMTSKPRKTPKSDDYFMSAILIFPFEEINNEKCKYTWLGWKNSTKYMEKLRSLLNDNTLELMIGTYKNVLKTGESNIATGICFSNIVKKTMGREVGSNSFSNKKIKYDVLSHKIQCYGFSLIYNK